MLPSFSLPSPAKSAYQRETLMRYRPDWRPRTEIMAERDRDPLQSQVSKVIQELDPDNSDAASTVKLRTEFATQLDKLQRQVRTESSKIDQYLQQLRSAEKSLQALRENRAAEPPRWRASYDLLLAQLPAIQARVRAYRGCLTEFVRNPKTRSKTKTPNLTLVGWRTPITKTSNDIESIQDAKRAASSLRAVIRDHAGTPWARTSEWELKPGFRMALLPPYQSPLVKIANPSPVPRL